MARLDEQVSRFGRIGYHSRSVVFRFSQLYDKRNLPSMIVYQYERAGSPSYPWGVVMPVSGQLRAAVRSLVMPRATEVS